MSCSSAPKPRLCRVRLLGKDFPGRTVDKALPANAGHTGRPWSGKTARAAEQLSLRTAPAEPELRGERRRHGGKPEHPGEEQPPLAAVRESPCAAGETQSNQN